MSCIACGSPDTVSYWQNADESPSTLLLKNIYPRARRCVDCDAIEHDTQRRPALLKLAAIVKEQL